MLIDSRLEFAVEQELTSTGNSTNRINLVDAPRKLGPGRPMYVCVLVHNADGSATDETYSMALQTDETDAFSSAEDIATLVIPRGSSDELFVIGFPFKNDQYLRLRTTLGGTSPELNYSAWLTDQEPQSWMPYAAPSQV